MYILIINSGSSSLKFKLFDYRLTEIISGIIERIGLTRSFLEVKEGKYFFDCSDHQKALDRVLIFLQEQKIELSQIKSVGHRVVHGGEEFIAPTVITVNNLKKLEKYNILAPLHNPGNILGIKSCLKLLPKAKNVVVFDTAFYYSLPEHIFRYPLPEKFYSKYKIRKYGFHGISHEYVLWETAKRLNKKINNLNIISCHLGSGCSITAIKNGKAIDTSLGFTPLEGLMMSSRSGSIDPAIVLYLLNQGMEPMEIDELLNKKSGLLGVSGFKDMRDIMIGAGFKIPGYQAKKMTDKQKKNCELALEMFIYRVQNYISSYRNVLGRVDALVFTAGIGERNRDVRNLIVKGLIDQYPVLVIPTNEELLIAKKILALKI